MPVIVAVAVFLHLFYRLLIDVQRLILNYIAIILHHAGRIISHSNIIRQEKQAKRSSPFFHDSKVEENHDL